MKYYSYISNTKLDMMFPQIPKPFLEDISGELSVNFGLLKATLKDKGLTSNRLSKLDAVVKYIEKYQGVGELSSPSTYIKGTANMYSVVMDEGMVMFCWCGSNENTQSRDDYLLLSGSSQHLIGMDELDMQYTHSITHLVLKRLSRLREAQAKLEEKMTCENGVCVMQGQESYLEDIKRWASVRSGPPQKYEYLARILINENEDGNSPDSGGNVVLATPIYIAMVD